MSHLYNQSSYYDDENTYAQFKRQYQEFEDPRDVYSRLPRSPLWEPQLQPYDFPSFEHGFDNPFPLSPRSKNEVYESVLDKKEPVWMSEDKPHVKSYLAALREKYDSPLQNHETYHHSPIGSNRNSRSPSISPSRMTPSLSPSRQKDIKITYEWTVFVKGFSQNCSKKDLEEFFEMQCQCEIVHVALPISRTSGMNRRIAWISFTSAEGLRRALTFHGETILGGNLHIEVSKNDRNKLLQKKTVFVWGLSNTFNRADMEQLFMFAGSIKGIRIPKNNTRPIAFVEYYNHADARRSLCMDGRLYRGHKIHVDFARSSNKQ